MITEPSFEDRVNASLGNLRAAIIVVAVFMVVAMGLAAYGFATGTEAQHATDGLARRQAAYAQWQVSIAANVASHANKLAGDLAAERNQTILRACGAQNARHAAAIAELNHLIAAAARKLPPARRAALRASARGSVLLIEALAPYENCQRQLQLATKTQ